MKLRFKLMAITLLAMLAFVGVGFASWTFKNSVSTSDIAAEKEVAVAVEMDRTFALKAYTEAAHTNEITKLYLICDAPTAGTDNYLAGSGVYWASDAAGANRITDLYILGQLEYDPEDGVKPLSSVTVTFTVANTLAANDYVTFDSTATVGDDVVISSISDGAEVAYTLPLPTPSYTAAVIAYNSVAQVTAMKNALVVSGSIKVSASITAKTE